MPQENITLQSHKLDRIEPRVKLVDRRLETGGWGGWWGTHVQVLQTVPAEGVFAALAQHLRTALVPLDVDAAHGTLFDGRVRVAVGAGPAERAELADA